MDTWQKVLTSQPRVGIVLYRVLKEKRLFSGNRISERDQFCLALGLYPLPGGMDLGCWVSFVPG